MAELRTSEGLVVGLIEVDAQTSTPEPKEPEKAAESRTEAVKQTAKKRATAKTTKR
jgi:hypothetical protein